MGKDKKEKATAGRGNASDLKAKVVREISAGGVVFKKEKGKVFWLVTKNVPNEFFKLAWRLPKGWIDEGETSESAALREVREEAGVEAKIIKKIDTISYIYNHPERGKVFKLVSFYLMEWLSDLLDGFDEETSEIAWLPYEIAVKKLSFSGEKQMLKKAKNLQDQGIQDSLL